MCEESRRREDRDVGEAGQTQRPALPLRGRLGQQADEICTGRTAREEVHKISKSLREVDRHDAPGAPASWGRKGSLPGGRTSTSAAAERRVLGIRTSRTACSPPATTEPSRAHARRNTAPCVLEIQSRTLSRSVSERGASTTPSRARSSRQASKASTPAAREATMVFCGTPRPPRDPWRRAPSRQSRARTSHDKRQANTLKLMGHSTATDALQYINVQRCNKTPTRTPARSGGLGEQAPRDHARQRNAHSPPAHVGDRLESISW